MKKAYICHPLRGDHPHDISKIHENYTKVDRICQEIAREEPDTLVLSPLHAFGFFSPQGDQTAPLRMCIELLCMADELRVYGDWRTSEGCCMEIERARKKGIPVFFPEAGHGDA